MKIPQPDKKSAELFNQLVPEDPHVTVRPMFGNVSAFVNGNMFFGLFGNDLFVRLPERDQAELLKEKGASKLEPMKGRPMKDYVIMPKEWRENLPKMKAWISKSLSTASKLPSKKPKK